MEMVGILEGLDPPPGRRGVSEASEQTDRASWSSDASEASLPRRLLALLPALLPARLVGPLAVDPPRLGSVRDALLVCVVPPFSPVSEPRLEWKVGLFSLDPDAAPLDDAEAVGVAGAEGAEGREAPLWEAEEEERVGEALREPGLERRPRDRKAARP